MGLQRFQVVRDSFNRQAIKVETPSERPAAYFGSMVFDRSKMVKYLDAQTCAALLDCMDNGAHLDRATADKVAEGMRVWAMENGVTHVTHWFQPLTEGTAEKHDSFLEFDSEGKLIEQFDGKSLVQQEPDASSFPNGGIRATFEARGYTAWDPTSPVFIHDDTLCIPTLFVSFTGEALDYKTPLKRSIKAVTEAALPICRMFDKKVKKVYNYLGWEQEYFLVDQELYCSRPDLMLTGRTLMGHESSKNQQLEDHYFGAIPTRVEAFFRDVEVESYKLGIPLKTHHNEAAPNQFEIAPIFGETNISNDQNQLVINIMRSTARKHGFVVLLHEKPYKGINGSGKHNNWSLGTDTGTMLMAPGKDSNGNLQFITFFVNVLAAVQKHNAVLKAAIATATNSHRLGGNEAPPAIVSAFLGRTMTDVLHKLLEMPSDTPIQISGKKSKSLGLVEIPEIFVDNTDRNRTSPFAFTGNRFEFRMPGASVNVSCANFIINTAVADALRTFADELEGMSSESLPKAAMDLIRRELSAHKRIIFNGNGYGDLWVKEAVERGLLNIRSAPEAYSHYDDEKNIRLFSENGILDASEVRSRKQIGLSEYVKIMNIEVRTMIQMIDKQILPAVMKYSGSLSESLGAKTSAGLPCCCEKEILGKIEDALGRLYENRKKLGELFCEEPEDAQEAGLFINDTVKPVMAACRSAADELEPLVDKEFWPFPDYTDILFYV